MPWGTMNHVKFLNVIGSEKTKFWCEQAWSEQTLDKILDLYEGLSN